MSHIMIGGGGGVGSPGSGGVGAGGGLGQYIFKTYSGYVAKAEVTGLLDDLHRASIGNDSEFARWLRREFIPNAKTKMDDWQKYNL